MTEALQRQLKQAYAEIIQRFSIAKYKDNTVFIQHFGPLEELETNFLYNESYDRAVKEGYLTEKQRLEQLDGDRLWTSGDENNLEGIKISVRSLLVAKKKAFLKRDIDSINNQIAEQEKLFTDMYVKRDTLIGATVEKFSKRHVDFYLIQSNFYLDIPSKKLLYSKEEFDELDQSSLNELFNLYNGVMEKFSILNIRKIALAPFFQNSFALADKVYEFYGQPLCYLTDYQVQLGSYGNHYKNILSSDTRPPDELLDDPDKFEDWHSSRANVEQMLDKNVQQEDGDVSIMGASKEDLKNWGYEQAGTSLREETKKAGGVLDKEAMMRLAGII